MNPQSFIGESDVVAQMRHMLGRMARSDAHVLIRGETGSGKELAARSLHYQSARKGGPFVPVNCAGLPAALIESELFGHVKGAFTGASQNHDGLVAEADGGTLFLDEVDALAPRAQASLLRFLEDHRYRPVGSSRSCRADLRVVAATNADLEQMIEAAGFRQDLYYRLSSLVLDVPPLRARAGDVLLLAELFLDRHRPGDDPAIGLSPIDRAALLAHDWPGNVRELENTILRGVLLAENGRLALPEQMRAAAGPAPPPPDEPRYDGGMRSVCRRELRKIEARYLRWLMRKTRGNVSQAARFAKTDRRHIGRKLQELGIDRTRFL